MSVRPVLVVEDDDCVRESTKALLEFEGYIVVEAANGAEALKLLASLPPHERPSCILLDLMMPVMDGKTFLKVLARDHADYVHMNILIWTAKGSASEEIFDFPRRLEVVSKAADVDHLLDAVEKHCGKPH